MKKNHIVFLLLGFFFVGHAYAETKEYIRDYKYQATDYDSKHTSRIYALDGVKLDLSNELGSYVQSVINQNQDSLGNTYMSHDIVNLTASIISLKILDEKWDRITYYIKALMKADRDEVLQSIDKLLGNHKLQESLKESMEELETARNEIDGLRAKLKNQQFSASAENVKKYSNAVMAMEAEMLFQKALQSQREGDFSKTIIALKALAENGYAPSQSRLGHMYERGRGVKKDYEQAMHWYLQALRQNYPKAISRIGFMYERGLGVTKNLFKAAEHYQKASDVGEKLATARLGYLYETGGGVTRDTKKALSLYRKAAEQGGNQGRARLGHMYQQGLEVEQDFDEARRLYELAANNGSGLGMMLVGALHLRGKGVEQSNKEALKYFKASYKYGNPSGAAYLGHMYEMGLGGVDKDINKAVVLYKEGAAEGGVYALFKMGHIYHKGKGVDKDMHEAIKWYRLASDRGNKKAKKRLEKLLDKLDKNK